MICVCANEKKIKESQAWKLSILILPNSMLYVNWVSHIPIRKNAFIILNQKEVWIFVKNRSEHFLCKIMLIFSAYIDIRSEHFWFKDHIRNTWKTCRLEFVWSLIGLFRLWLKLIERFFKTSVLKTFLEI